jgi:hypothetical protein
VLVPALGPLALDITGTFIVVILDVKMPRFISL